MCKSVPSVVKIATCQNFKGPQEFRKLDLTPVLKGEEVEVTLRGLAVEPELNYYMFSLISSTKKGHAIMEDQTGFLR